MKRLVALSSALLAAALLIIGMPAAESARPTSPPLFGEAALYASMLLLAPEVRP